MFFSIGFRPSSWIRPFLCDAIVAPFFPPIIGGSAKVFSAASSRAGDTAFAEDALGDTDILRCSERNPRKTLWRRAVLPGERRLRVRAWNGIGKPR